MYIQIIRYVETVYIHTDIVYERCGKTRSNVFLRITHKIISMSGDIYVRIMCTMRGGNMYIHR